MSKFEELRKWMEANDVTFAWAAEQMGVTPSLLGKTLRKDRMPPKRHAELVALHFPPELLPRPESGYGPRKRKVPVWVRED